MQGFSEIRYFEEIDGTPAAVDPQSGVLYISRREFEGLPKPARAYIIYHELGHLNGRHSETGADKYALNKMQANGYRMGQGVRALTNNLNMQVNGHRQRAIAAARYARQNSSYSGNLNEVL